MCGIAGFCRPSGLPPHSGRELIERMTATLEHRGPDDAGIFVDAQVALGHRRLSIIDLENGRQPMANEDGSVHVVFNGEIYNHGDLRQLLQSKGHVFRTRSDTETIVHAYEEWGESCPERLRGMFAFAIWDTKRRRLFLARDRLGKKPLYYAVLGDGTVAFGSEIKALIPIPDLELNLDIEALSDYVSLLYVPRDKTIFREIRKLLPGHTLTADHRGLHLREFWDISFAANADTTHAAETVAQRLRDAVAVRLQSDVPLGAFLSGGVDSSAVVGLMAQLSAAPVTTASIGFREQGFDELPFAREVATLFATDHREDVVTADALAIIDRLIWHYDEPFADASAVPTYYVAQLARRRVTVALSGDGGDESFAGYRRYWFDVRENKVRTLIPTILRRPVFRALGALYPKADYLPQVFRAKAFLGNVAREPWEAYLHSVSGVSEADKDSLLRPDLRRALAGYRTADLFADLHRAADGPDAISKIQYIDFKTYLPDDILTKVDRASMAHALEVRCPFLDHALVEYAAALPSRLKLHGTQSKIVLKEAMRGLLPESILARPKMGFAMPVSGWLSGPLQGLVDEELSDSTWMQDLFEPATVRTWRRQHRSGLRDRTTELWALLIFGRWYRRFGTARRQAWERP